MKSTAIFLALISTCAFAMQSGSQVHMQLENSMKKLNQSPWGQVAASFLDL